MQVANKEYSRDDLLRRSADLSSLFGARRMTITDGRGAGLRVIEVKTAGGLQMLLNEDRCLDILELSYKGNNIGLLTVNGANANTYADPSNPDEFGRYWSAGMLTTCGLRNAGPSNECDGEVHPLHGRIGVTPASNVGIAVGEDGVITITGTMRECAIGRCLDMQRTITVAGDGAKVRVDDRICNNAHNDEIVFMLYHLNFGFPFLDDGIELDLPKGEVKPRTEYAEKYIGSCTEITGPLDNEEEQCFFHMAAEKSAKANILNKNLGIKATISYDAEKLPVLVEWKNMSSGNYALGIEPSSSTIKGRKDELAGGYQTTVKAFGTLDYGFALELADL